MQQTKKETYEQLEKDVIQLNESMNILHELIHEQKESIDSIEEFIHETKKEVIVGKEELKESDSYLSFTHKIGISLIGIVCVILFL